MIAEPLPAPCAGSAGLKHLLGTITSRADPELFLLPCTCWRLCREGVGFCCVALLLSLPVPSARAIPQGTGCSLASLFCFIHFSHASPWLSQLLWAGAGVISIRSSREKPQAHRTDDFVVTGSWEKYFSPGNSILHALSRAARTPHKLLPRLRILGVLIPVNVLVLSWSEHPQQPVPGLEWLFPTLKRCFVEFGLFCVLALSYLRCFSPHFHSLCLSLGFLGGFCQAAGPGGLPQPWEPVTLPGSLSPSVWQPQGWHRVALAFRGADGGRAGPAPSLLLLPTPFLIQAGGCWPSWQPLSLSTQVPVCLGTAQLALPQLL
nr:uncharacterized protein LOC121470967 [Taeniopygia guttata]